MEAVAKEKVLAEAKVQGEAVARMKGARKSMTPVGKADAVAKEKTVADAKLKSVAKAKGAQVVAKATGAPKSITGCF